MTTYSTCAQRWRDASAPACWLPMCQLFTPGFDQVGDLAHNCGPRPEKLCPAITKCCQQVQFISCSCQVTRHLEGSTPPQQDLMQAESIDTAHTGRAASRSMEAALLV